MTPISTALAAVTVGEAKQAGRLTVFPLVAVRDEPASYLLLDESLAKGVASVTEISEGGAVPELRFENRSDQPILIVDGEALIGAKQDRIVNISILVPAHSVTPIPVSCVEQGRWSYRKRDFATARHMLYSSSRAHKAHDVSASLRDTGRAHSDQSAIWADIASKSRRMDTSSHSGAMDAMFEKTQQDLDELEQRLKPEINEVGAVFALDGRVVGLEVFDAAATWQRFAPKVHRSYGLDALDAGTRVEHGAVDVAGWLRAVAAAPVAEFPSIGLGHDARFEDPRISGGALVVGQGMVHCAAFDSVAWK